MVLAAGDLDRRITIRRNAATAQDDMGVIPPDWQPLVSNLPAAWREMGGREAERNPQIVAELDAIAKIRWINVPIDTAMQIQDEAGRLYEIRSIAELPGRRQGYEILVRNLDAKGATA